MSFAQDDGWTVVRYGRGRSRGQPDPRPPPQTQFRPRERGRWEPSGMDRAPPAPRSWGQVYPFVPNQPVPPAGFSTRPYRPPLPPRDFGPQFRSYAEVVRQANPGRDGDGFVQRTSWNKQRRYFSPKRNQQTAPTDPTFGKLVRQLHKVIKTVHHLQNVTVEPDKQEPRMISRMVEVLATMIKPAVPNANTTDMIVGNAKNWGHTTLMILCDHYKAALEKMLEDLSKDLKPDWKAAFGVATKWARKNLPRLTRDEVDHAEALITASIEVDGVPNEGTGPDPQHQQEEEQGQEIPQTTRGRGTREDSSQVEFLEEVVDLASEQQCMPSRGKRSVSTMTSPRAQTPEPQPEIEEQDLASRPILPQSPKERRAARFPRQSSVNIQTEEPPQIWEDLPKDFTGMGEGFDTLLEEELAREMDDTPTLVPQRTFTVAAQVHRDAMEDSLVDLEEPMPEASALSLISTPQLQKYGPTRHIRTDRKMMDWTLSVSKKWLFIGDSNLCRMPQHTIPDLQIDSYPGANFRHASSFLAKATGQVVVEKLVLSFGLNSRGQKVKETTIKQMQTAVRMAKRRFPYSEIWIPLINYSSSLPQKEQLNLKQLNEHIFKNMPYIGLLPPASFNTEKDNIHWTKTTAEAVFDHWVSVLNLKAP